MNPGKVRCEMYMIVAEDALIFFSFILVTAYTRTSTRVGFLFQSKPVFVATDTSLDLHVKSLMRSEVFYVFIYLNSII